MILGVTGSRENRPDNMAERLFSFMVGSGVRELHHGDCTGWDEQAFQVARAVEARTGQRIRIIAHPCNLSRWRAHTASDEVRPVLKPLDRNRNIVAAADFVIAAPSGPEVTRSGTWSTVRYAKRIGVRGVVWPTSPASPHSPLPL